MYISRLEVENYRNYKKAVIEPNLGLTVLVGPNATGKTNLIEAIQVLTTGRSFRNPKWNDVVRWGSESARLSMWMIGDARESRVDITMGSDARRVFRLNGTTKRRSSDATNLAPCVIFTPDDLTLAKGPADRRRSAIDDLGEQLSKTYGSIRRDYLKTVRQRNTVLRDGRPDPVMKSVLDEQLVKLGASLTTHRRRLLQKVREGLVNAYAELADNESLDVAYHARILEGLDMQEPLEREEAESRFREQLARRANDELIRQTTLVGPHRDDIVFLIDGREARMFASQGQQRTIALAWKWAEVETIQQVVRKQPILLLDDVMSELDARRRHSLTLLMQGQTQTFVTTTNTTYFQPELLDDSVIIDVGCL